MKRLSSLVGACFGATFLAACGGGANIGAPAPGDGGLGMPPSAASRASGNERPLTQENVVYTFQGGTDGVAPYAALLVKSNEFYGTTFNGGVGPSGGFGTVYKLSPSSVKSVLYTFQGGNDAANPEAGLIAGKGGVLYGDTAFGGGATKCTGGCGAVFELTPSGSGYSERVIYAFQGGSDGIAPVGNLLLDKSGALYGTTDRGGGTPCAPGSLPPGCGTVFKLTPAGSGYTETIVYRFQGGNDGALVPDGLIRDANGALYGTTQAGGGSGCDAGSGVDGCGTIFKLSPAGSGYTESVLHRFQGAPNDGSRPHGALLAGKNGVFYGVTVSGGPHSACMNNGVAGCGTVFDVKTSGKERVLYSFGVAGDGQLPFDDNGLDTDSNGALYGTTELGGTAKCACGTVFKLAPSGSGYTETVLHSFKGSSRNDGSGPRTSLRADTAGALYGTTPSGGSGVCSSGGCGVVFKVSP